MGLKYVGDVGPIMLSAYLVNARNPRKRYIPKGKLFPLVVEED